MKKIIQKIHLWLGLSSGLVVFILALTGCIYAFQQEIEDATQPFRFVKAENRAFLPPTYLKEIAEHALPHKNLHAIQYADKSHAAQAIYYSGGENPYYYIVYLNPYSGKILEVQNANAGFFRWVLNGHYYLWLPPQIGQPVVASATLIFLVLCITGLILWWPKNKKVFQQRTTVKWSAKWRRKNYDIHAAFGFYSLFFALIFAVTGLVWGFQWFAKGYYSALSLGKNLPEYEALKIKNASKKSSSRVDEVYQYMLKSYPKETPIEIHFPETMTDPIEANANPAWGTYWNIDYRYFHPQTLKELQVKHLYGRSTNLSAADKIYRMNYDIHVGGIIGLPGKIIAFCASLIIATMPISGCLIWWGRRYKTKKATIKP